MQNLLFRVVPAGDSPGGRVVSWKNGLKLSRLESRARLIALTGAAESTSAGTPNYIYAYDSNGNRTLDSRTGLEFTHNLLDMPVSP